MFISSILLLFDSFHIYFFLLISFIIYQHFIIDIKSLNSSHFTVNVKFLNQNFVQFYEIEKNHIDEKEYDVQISFKSSIYTQRQ